MKSWKPYHLLLSPLLTIALLDSLHSHPSTCLLIHFSLFENMFLLIWGWRTRSPRQIIWHDNMTWSPIVQLQCLTFSSFLDNLGVITMARQLHYYSPVVGTIEKKVWLTVCAVYWLFKPREVKEPLPHSRAEGECCKGCGKWAPI